MFYLKGYQVTKMARILRGKWLFSLNFLRYRLRILQAGMQQFFRKLVSQKTNSSEVLIIGLSIETNPK